MRRCISRLAAGVQLGVELGVLLHFQASGRAIGVRVV